MTDSITLPDYGIVLVRDHGQGPGEVYVATYEGSHLRLTCMPHRDHDRFTLEMGSPVPKVRATNVIRAHGSTLADVEIALVNASRSEICAETILCWGASSKVRAA